MGIKNSSPASPAFFLSVEQCMSDNLSEKSHYITLTVIGAGYLQSQRI